MPGIATPSTVECATLVEVLRLRAQEQRHQQAYSFLAAGDEETDSLTFAELDQKARAIGALLQQLNAEGERALLLYPPGLDFIAAFFGCLYGGVVAVPAYPPRFNRTLQRLQSIIRDCRPRVAFTTATIQAGIDTWLENAPELKSVTWLNIDQIPPNSAEQWREYPAGGETLAWLQYTSGSTAVPKGVMVSHGNVLHNSQYIDEIYRHTPESKSVSWLPNFHDMGLIYGVVQPLYKGFLGIQIPPAAFLQRPVRWLQVISRYKATHSAAPNFGYDLSARKVTAAQLETLDLSSWRIAVNGAEPIRRETLERFASTFAPCGFRRSSFCPAYGLAEATLMVTTAPWGQGSVFDKVNASALANGKIIPSLKEEQDVQLVGCGGTSSGMEVAIVHQDSLTRCRPNEVGEIWVSGPSIAKGYWERPAETEQTFHAYTADTGQGPFLRTGDLGYSRDGQLFITGRLKDLIIIDGRNHYPQDIELTTEQSHPAIRPNCCAAFSIELNGQEQLVIVAEVERTYRHSNLDEVVKAVRRSVSEDHDLRAHAIRLIRPGSIPKTSSGKIQRHACRTDFLAETLGDKEGEW